MSTLANGQKLVALMRHSGYAVEAINIVFIRDADRETWTPNGLQPDRWNDVAVLVRSTGEVLGSYTATCEPGRFYTENPMNPGGAFRLAADYQHKNCWKMGQHFGRPALEQVAPLEGYRDKNQNFVSEGSEACTAPPTSKVNVHNCGNRNGVNLDGGEFINQWSAGCCVVKFNQAWQKFLATVKGMGKSAYTVTIVKGTTLANFVPGLPVDDEAD